MNENPIEINKYTEALGVLDSFNTKASLLTEQFVNLSNTLAMPSFVSAIDDMNQRYLKIGSLESIWS